MAGGDSRGYERAQFYVWEASGSELSIHLSLRVVEELMMENLRAMAAGLASEIRGILLGRSICAPTPATFVEDFVLIPQRGGSEEEDDRAPSDDDLRERSSLEASSGSYTRANRRRVLSVPTRRCPDPD